jgi:hypothetical protein
LVAIISILTKWVHYGMKPKCKLNFVCMCSQYFLLTKIFVYFWKLLWRWSYESDCFFEDLCYFSILWKNCNSKVNKNSTLMHTVMTSTFFKKEGKIILIQCAKHTYFLLFLNSGSWAYQEDTLHLSHAPSHFCCRYFLVGYHIHTQDGLDWNPSVCVSK